MVVVFQLACRPDGGLCRWRILGSEVLIWLHGLPKDCQVLTPSRVQSGWLLEDPIIHIPMLQ